MNKYNLKGLLKMYQILKHNNIHLTPESLKQFDYRLLQQLNLMDHESTNSILEMCQKSGYNYQSKSNNKLLRGINMRLMKNKITMSPDHVYKTLKLLWQMKFPKSTFSRVLYKLVSENEANKRMLNHVDNLSALRISLLAVEGVETELEIKKRVLENLLLIKPKGVVELSYFYAVLKQAVSRLDESVRYEAQKKSVYQLAFNPYSMYEANQQTPSSKQPIPASEQSSLDKSKQVKSVSPDVNQTILRRLLQQKEKIIEETLNKLNVQKLSQQLHDQLSGIMNDSNNNNEQLSFKQLKQVALLLIANKFGEDSRQNQQLVLNIVMKVVEQGLSNNLTSNNIDPSKLIRLPEFIILMQQLHSHSSDKHQVQTWFNTYHQTYFQFMNLQEKLLFTYHRSKILSIPVPLKQIQNYVTQANYGLDADEFIWLHKVLSLNKETQSGEDKQIVKNIWKLVEASLDEEISSLKQQKQQQSQQTFNQRDNQNPKKQSQQKDNRNNAQHPKSKDSSKTTQNQ